MLRRLMLILLATAFAGPASAADQIVPHSKPHARIILPPGLPRPHYDYRTTIVRRAPPPPLAYVEPEAEALISPWVWTTPLLPGSSTLPGYYGRPFDYYYQGPYYGGSDEYDGSYRSYYVRLPYACGIYGYC